MSKADLERITLDLEKKYNHITKEHDSKEKEIKQDISDINSKISALALQRENLKKQDYQNGVDYEILKNNAAGLSAINILYSLDGNIVDIHFSNKMGRTFSNISGFDFSEINNSLVIQKKESIDIEMDNALMFDSLNQIAGAVDFYREFKNFFDMACSELNQRKKESEFYSKILLNDFINEDIKKTLKDKVSRSCDSLDKLKDNLTLAKERVGEENNLIKSNLPRIIRESCDAPISDFKKKNGLYIKKNKDKYAMLIDNCNKFISNGLLKKIGVDPKTYPKLIYLEADKESFDPLENMLKNSYMRKNQKFDFNDSIRSAIEDNYKQLGLTSVGAFSVGTLGGIITQWANSWSSQTPVQHGEYSFIAGGILAGLGILGYSTVKGVNTTRDKINDIKRTNKKNNLLVDAIKNTRYVTDPLEITKNLALTYK